MRITPLFIATLLLLFALSQTWTQGLAARTPFEVRVLPWDHVAGRGALQMENNTTSPSFAELVSIILFILAGVGIAIVIVAAGLWIAQRARRGRGGEEQAQGAEGEKGKNGENDEWGAHWES